MLPDEPPRETHDMSDSGRPCLRRRAGSRPRRPCIDPHWVELRGESTLPTTYLPLAMPGERRLWQRVVAVGLAAMFLGATAAGVCLTYGPPIHGLW